MKITEVNTYYVRPRWGFVEIVTDEGYTGWGEAVLEGHCDAVLACVNEYKPYLIGKDPMRIEDIQATIYRAGFYRGGGVLMSAISGIDQCLWDIKGKFFGAPVWQLMGGACRDRMKVYSWIGGDRPSDVGSAAKERQDKGFTAIKMNATDELQMIDTYDKIDAVLERVAAIREACGKYFGIAIDFHGRVHKPMAKILAKKLEEFDPMFIEEPVLCENMDEFVEIRRAANIPIATGERLFTKYDFKYKSAVATVKVGKGVKSEGDLIVSGTKGYVYVPAPWWKMDYFELRYENPADNRRYFYQLDGEGIRNELVVFTRLLSGCATSYVRLNESTLISSLTARIQADN